MSAIAVSKSPLWLTHASAITYVRCPWPAIRSPMRSSATKERLRDAQVELVVDVQRLLLVDDHGVHRLGEDRAGLQEASRPRHPHCSALGVQRLALLTAARRVRLHEREPLLVVERAPRGAALDDGEDGAGVALARELDAAVDRLRPPQRR